MPRTTTIQTIPATDRRSGAGAVTAGLLLAASVGAELVHPVQASDGAVTAPLLFAAYLAAWILGAAALVVALLGPPGGDPTGRVGQVVGLAGAGLLLAFGLVVLVTGLATGTPMEVSFLAFALGLLLLSVGAGLLAVSAQGLGRAALAVVATGALVALLAPHDPWHDLGLLVSFGGSVVLGLGLLRDGAPARQGRRTTPGRKP